MKRKPARSALTRRELVLGMLAGCAGCAQAPGQPPLAEIYADIGARAERPPLIVVPGAFGSRLRRRSDGHEIWPGSNRELMFSRYREIELEIDPRTLAPSVPDVEPAGLFLNTFGRDFYRTLLINLEAAAGYRRGTLPQPERPLRPVCYVYDYDWRLDILTAVRGLHELVSRVAEAHGDPLLPVDILAHSSGGLVARYYARFGTHDALAAEPGLQTGAASPRVRRLVQIGTPNLGTIQAVLAHIRGEEVGLRYIPPEVVASCPGSTELMPHPAHDWALDPKGDPMPFDVYAIDSWKELRWSIFSPSVRRRLIRDLGSQSAADARLELLEAYLAKHLARGRRLQEVLSLPAPADEPRPYVFGGDCTPTLSRLVIEREADGFREHERARRIARGRNQEDLRAHMFEPGDGVVTRGSLLGRLEVRESVGLEPMPIARSMLLCARHQTLTANLSLQDNLFLALLAAE